jgi:hypothetical protein
VYQLPRQYIVNSWVGAAEYDEGDTYNGEQIGNRNQKSIGVLIERSGDQWKAGSISQDIPTFVHGRANVSAFSEPATKPKAPAKKKSVLDSILLADRNYTRLCGLSEQLDQELDSGQITDFDAYCAARKNIDQRLTKAWARVQRERCWDDQPEELPELSFSLEACTEQRRGFKIDYSVLSTDSVFSGLKDENLFKIGYTLCLTGCKALSKLLNNGKEILKEGLI